MATKIAERAALTTPASDDELLISDTSAGTTKKVTTANLLAGVDVTGLTDLAAAADVADEILIYDATAAANKKISIQDLVEYIFKAGLLSSDVVLYDDLKFPASAFDTGPANAPDWVALGGVYGGLYMLEFDPTTEEELFVAIQLPHKWKEGTAVKPHIHWVNHNDTTGDVVWAFEYTVQDIDGFFPGTPTTITVTDTCDANVSSEMKHQVASFSDIDLTGLEISNMIIGRVYRDATNVADTAADDVGFLEFDMHYQIDSLGSIGVLDKDGV